MYKRRNGQINVLESPMFFGGVKLDPENKWIKLAELMPWDSIEARYAERFAGSVTGNPAKPARMAIGTLIIKERYRLSDEDVVEEIQMNPYLQYYIGLPEFSHAAPFDASVITRFRKRVTPEMLSEVNDIVIERKTVEEENPKEPTEIRLGAPTTTTTTTEAPVSDTSAPDVPTPSESVSEKEPDPNKEPNPTENESTAENESRSESTNKGTMIFDATCAPQNIRYPTDISLLNEAREKLEGMIDAAHKAGYTEGKKPRSYRKRARRDYLRYARNRKPTNRLMRKSLRKQLSYVARDLSYVEQILKAHPEALNVCQLELLDTIRTLYGQQLEMYWQHTHSVPDRIVSLRQPHVRPIVRGKTATPVEFGSKIEMSMVEGYLRIEKLSWDAFNEANTLQESVERFKADMGHYPARILADRIFRTRENLAYCKENHIRMNGPKLGRPPKDEALRREQLRIEREESGERSEIEGGFGVGKRRYGLGCIMTRLEHTSEVSIHVIVLTMNLFRKLRLSSNLFFTNIFWSFFEMIFMVFRLFFSVDRAIFLVFAVGQ